MAKLKFKLTEDRSAYTVIGVGLFGKRAKAIDVPDMHKGKPVTAVEENAFAEVEQLQSVTLPQGITRIPEDILSRPSISAINVRENFSMDKSVDTNLTFYSSQDGVLYSGYGKILVKYPLGRYGSELVIPDGVTVIARHAFKDARVGSVVIPEGVEVIEEEAFVDATLGEVRIPDSVTTVGRSAFKGSSCTDVHIGGGISILEPRTFAYCQRLSHVHLPDSVTAIREGAFTGCTALRGVDITDLSRWCDVSFANADSNPITYAHELSLGGAPVTELSLPERMRPIGEYAFNGCSSLKALSLPKVESVSDSTFRGCHIQTATVPTRSLSAIPMAELTSLELVGSGKFGLDVLDSCPLIESVTVSEENEEYRSVDGNLYTKDGKKLVMYARGRRNTHFSVPDGVEILPPHSISNDRLQRITISDSVTHVPAGAVYKCKNLSSVTVGRGVEKINADSFEECPKLATVNYRGSESRWNEVYDTLYRGSNKNFFLGKKKPTYKVVFDYKGK